MPSPNGSGVMAGAERATRLSSPLAGEDTKPWRAALRRSWRGGEAAHNLAPSPSFASRQGGKLRYPLPQGERGRLAQ